MNAAMARATFEGRKTNTRRVIVPQPPMVAIHPYSVGDRLWVREAWRLPRDRDHEAGGDIPESGHAQAMKWISYEADGKTPEWAGRYRHGRFMPRWASRQLLEITRVAIERVQDITEADAIAEGVERNCDGLAAHPDCPPCKVAGKCQAEGEYRNYLDDTEGFPVDGARQSYATLWDSINKDRGFGWAANPWVWSVHLKVVTA